MEVLQTQRNQTDLGAENCIFWGASFELIKNEASLSHQKVQGFHGTFLYHCYTLVSRRENFPHKTFFFLGIDILFLGTNILATRELPIHNSPKNSVTQ